MPDSSELVPLMEEMIEQQRKMSQQLAHVDVKTDNINDKLDALAQDVDEHGRTLYRGNEGDGGVVGRLGRIEERVNARVDKVADALVAEIKRIEQQLAPIKWVGLALGGVTLTWIAGQFFGLIKP